jgi:hypothetical protein
VLPRREIAVIMGNFNAKIGEMDQDESIRHIVGKYDTREANA